MGGGGCGGRGGVWDEDGRRSDDWKAGGNQ